MKLLLVLASLCSAIVSSGQSLTDSQPAAFLKEFMLGKFDKNEIIYTQYAGDYNLREMISFISRDTLFGNRDPDHFIVLDQHEKDSSIALLQKQLLAKMEDGIYRDGEPIPRQKFKSIYKKDKKWRSVNNKRVYKGNIYSFSEPIVLRGNTLCLFYFGYYCGNRCAMGEFHIFKKNGEQWEHYITIFDWIS